MKENYTIRVNVQNFIVSILLIVAMFRPRSLNLYSSLSNYFNIFMALCVCLSILFFLTCIIRSGVKYFGTLAYLVIIYQAYELFCMYVNSTLSASSFLNAGILVCATVMTEYMIKTSPTEFIFVLSHYTGLLVFVNNLSFFSPPSSSFTDAAGNLIYFWQTRNHLSSLFFIAFVSTFIFCSIHRTRYSKIWNCFVLANIVWGTVSFNSSTLIVGVAVLLVMCFVFKSKSSLYRPIIWFCGALGLDIAIVFLRIQNIFAWLIEGVLHKNLTLTGRTSIWDAAILYVYMSPFFGYGESSIFNIGFGEIPAHNQYLDIAIVCGIPGLALFLLILFVSFKKLGDAKDSAFGRILMCALTGYMVMSISESPNPYQPWFIIFGLVDSISYLDKLYIPRASNISLEKGKILIRN